MNAHQEAAERRERAQEACEYLIKQGDVLLELSVPLINARRTFDAITDGGNNSPEVVQDFMDRLADIGSTVDDLLTELYAIMEPEALEDVRKEVKAETIKPPTSVAFESEVAEKVNATKMDVEAKKLYDATFSGNRNQPDWYQLPPAIQELWRERARKPMDARTAILTEFEQTEIERTAHKLFESSGLKIEWAVLSDSGRRFWRDKARTLLKAEAMYKDAKTRNGLQTEWKDLSQVMRTSWINRAALLVNITGAGAS